MPLFDVVAARPLENRCLFLRFEDGLEGTVCLDNLITNYGGVFAPLLDESFFRQMAVNTELGTVAWPNGADICPSTLYENVIK
jgi:hypothetical protein